MTSSLLDAETHAAVREAAERLQSAAASGTPVAPVRDLIGAADINLAYAVQQHVNQARIDSGAVVVGRKIGLTSKAVQEQLGVDQPDLGVLFADMEYDASAPVHDPRLIQPKAEAEIAFVLSADLAEGDLELDQVRAAIDYAVVALEICDSRIADWDIKFGDTVADNASAGGYVLGTERRTLAEFSPVDVEMTMTVTGQEDSTGSGAACLGDPLLAVQWLARAARDLGAPLQAGQVILSGALGPMRPITPGADIHISITGLGELSISMSKES